MAEENEDKITNRFSWIFTVHKYLWVVMDFIILAVILVIFSSETTKFEGIVYSLLVLIYLTIMRGFSTTTYCQAENWQLDYNRFQYIRGLLKKELNEGDKEDEAEEYENIKEKWMPNPVPFLFNIGFYFIFYFITIVNLLRVAVFSSY